MGAGRVYLDAREVIEGLRFWAQVFDEVGDGGAAAGCRRVAEDLEFKLVMLGAS